MAQNNSTTQKIIKTNNDTLKTDVEITDVLFMTNLLKGFEF